MSAGPATADRVGTASATRRRSVAGPLGLGVGGAAALLVVHRTGGELAFPVCPLHAATGLSCPFCGGMRAAAALTNGDLAGALSFNVLAVVILAAASAYWLRQMVVAVRGGVPRFPAISSRPLLVMSVVLVVFAVWRNIPALPLAGYLAP